MGYPVVSDPYSVLLAMLRFPEQVRVVSCATKPPRPGANRERFRKVFIGLGWETALNTMPLGVLQVLNVRLPTGAPRDPYAEDGRTEASCLSTPIIDSSR